LPLGHTDLFGKGGGSRIPTFGFGDRCSAVELRPSKVGAGREDRTRVIGLEDRCLCHSARPARNHCARRSVFVRKTVWWFGNESNVHRPRPGGLQPLGVASPAMPNRNWYLRDESNVPSGIRSPSAGVPRRRCGALSMESNLVISRLQGARRLIWPTGHVMPSPPRAAAAAMNCTRRPR
jgi:hypothetical protein